MKNLHFYYFIVISGSQMLIRKKLIYSGQREFIHIFFKYVLKLLPTNKVWCQAESNNCLIQVTTYHFMVFGNQILSISENFIITNSQL
jgi:hypothetical protein